jgi:hypothetical protein
MENGKWDEANVEKVRLEEKQRAARRIRDAEAEKAAADGMKVWRLIYMALLLCYEILIFRSFTYLLHALKEVLQIYFWCLLKMKWAI